MTKFFQIARMSLGALWANPFRTALTTLGIIIGIASVILLTALGGGVRKQITGQFAALGANTIQISPGAGDDDDTFSVAAASTLTVDDARRVAGLPSVAAASPVVPVATTVGGRAIVITGVDPAYARIRTVPLDAGRFVAAPGELVLGTDAATALFGTPAAALDQTVTIGGAPYRVVGISLAQASGFGPAPAAPSYLLADDARRLSGNATVGQIIAEARDGAAVEGAANKIRAALTDAHVVEDFRVENQRQLLASFTQFTDLLTALLAGIAGISLVVGGIGIMNIMLVSVAERTREIGLRKALGATNGDVMSQFLIEALLLSLGGALGVAAGVGLAAAASALSANLPTQVTAVSVALAFGVAAAIGVLFGTLPAVRSARLQPVEALRRE